MLTCPRCNVGLASVVGQRGARFVCPRCEGQALTVVSLRNQLDSRASYALWKAADDPALAHMTACPSCLGKATRVPSGLDASMYIDVCKRCQLVWLDRGELEQLTARHSRPPAASTQADKTGATGELPESARKELALLKVKAMRLEYEETAAPPTFGGQLAGYLDFPVVTHATPLVEDPIVTWVVAALMTLATLWAQHERLLLELYGFVPALPWRHFGFTLVTSFFLHAGLLHLIGNGYFLLVFGPHVEQLLGSPRYALLLIAGSLCGTLAHSLVCWGSSVPVVGASDSISAILVLYALAFPHARIRVVFWRPVSWGYGSRSWIQLSARAAFGFWIASQVLGLAAQVAGTTNISAAAHLGGVAMGALAFWLVRAPGQAGAEQAIVPWW